MENSMSKATKIIEMFEAEEPKIDRMWIKGVLRKAGIKVKDVKMTATDEYEIDVGAPQNKLKVGKEWEKAEDKIYTALEKAGWLGENSKVSIFC